MDIEKLRGKPRVCRYRIHAPEPGAYVEGFGVLKTGSEVDLPKEVPPQTMWWPLNDAAWEAFEAEGRVPKTEKEIANLHGRISEHAGLTDEEKAAKEKEKAEKRKAAIAAVRRLRKDFQAAEEEKQAEEKKPEPDDTMTLSELARGGKGKGRAADQAQ